MASNGKQPPLLHTAGGARVVTYNIDTWPQFVNIIDGWPAPRNWCFRGQGDAKWKLEPSLTRHIAVSRVDPGAWKDQESRIARIFRRKCHLFLDRTPQPDATFEWLALMQHHGAPTRLLDFTWSPYVAAFFALERASENAAIWALNLPLLGATHRRYRIKTLDPRYTDIEKFEKHYLSNRHNFVWQGDPYLMPQRVVAQSGTFLVLSRLGTCVEDILQTYPGEGTLLIKFVLNTSKLRSKAMADLYSMNITQATLYPGLDGLARSMYYEFEYSWQVDPRTNAPLQSLVDPRLLPAALLAAGVNGVTAAPTLAGATGAATTRKRTRMPAVRSARGTTRRAPAAP
jgi:hypothetical protein